MVSKLMRGFLQTTFLNVETAAYHGLFEFGFLYMFNKRYFDQIGLNPFIVNLTTSIHYEKVSRTPIKQLGSNVFSECGRSRFTSLMAKGGVKPITPLNAFSLLLPFSQFVKTEHSDAYVKQQSIKNSILISSYRGLRHNTNLPVRGQRTHTNAKTRRKYKVV